MAVIVLIGKVLGTILLLSLVRDSVYGALRDYDVTLEHDVVRAVIRRRSFQAASPRAKLAGSLVYHVCSTCIAVACAFGVYWLWA